MDEKHYHTIADSMLTHYFDRLDHAYEAGTVEELDLEGGILTIVTPKHRTYLVTKHAPTQQLWYASPNLGGLHFTAPDWTLADGRRLTQVLSDELRAEGIEATL